MFTVIARDQLLHIAVMLQGEVIRSLQMTVQFEHAVLDLGILYEASITNRKQTFVTLDQLKQRLLPRMPMSRPLPGLTNSSRSRRSPISLTMAGKSTFDPTNYIPDNYIPPAVTLTTQEKTKESKHGLSDYFRDLKRNNGHSESPPSTQTRHSKTPEDINFSPAFQHLLASKGSEDREVITQEILRIMDSMQISPKTRSDDPWANNMPVGYGFGERRDTLSMLNAADPYPRDPLTPTREMLQMPKVLPPTPEEFGARGYPQQPTFNNGIFDPPHDHPSYHQQYAAKNPYPHLQTQTSHPRWSTTSGASSSFSEAPSLDRNSSTSSQDSRNQAHHLSQTQSSRALPAGMQNQSSSPNTPAQHYEFQNVVQPPSAPYAPATDLYAQTIVPPAPLNFRNQTNAPTNMPQQSDQSTNAAGPSSSDRNSLMYSPYATPYQHPQAHFDTPYALPQQQQQPHHPSHPDQETVKPDSPTYSPMPTIVRDAPSTHSNTSERTITQSILPVTTLGTAPATAGLRHYSVAESIASTNSSGSASIGIIPGPRMKSIRSETIQSGPAGQERMMNGRPCKANNYWGFCKGAWTVREDTKKGLALRTQPSGMYNTKEIWECRECTFKGSTFSAPHPTKKNKSVTVVDPRIMTSQSKIKYKWIFLAKSHIKKKTGDSHTEESNYGCVFCSLEDKVSSYYGGVETLMNHIALSHAANMSENTRRKARCIVGRAPGPAETEWDIWIPIFERVEELA